jgi:hypothetical protein
MTETVTLTVPRQPEYFAVVRMVVGGIASGLSLSYDALDDLQLAIGSILDSDGLGHSDAVTVRVHIDGDQMRAELGPFDADRAGKAFEGAAEPALDLRRLLDTIVDEVVLDTDSGEGWVHLTKLVKAAAV